MKYVVTRQIYWGSGAHVVEIASGGMDYSNPDALAPKFQSLGEFREFDDPREAVEAAVRVAAAWRKNGGKGKRISIAHGCTLGMTMDFEPTTIKESREWAEAVYARLPRCPVCASVMPDADSDDKRRERYVNEDSVWSGEEYCSERCAEKAWACSAEQEEEEG